MIIKTKNYFTMNLLWNIKSGKQSCAKKTLREGKKLGLSARNVSIIGPMARRVG